MPRKEELPDRELAICRRLRVFRESTRMARTVFAAEAGIVGARLLNCELGVTPLNYGLFKAINRRFFLRPDWLLGGEGVPTDTEPFNPGGLTLNVEDRELFSSVCDRLLLAVFEEEKRATEEKLYGENGFVAALKNIHAGLKNPDVRKSIPRDVLIQLSADVERWKTMLEQSIAESERVEDVEGKLRRKSSAKKQRS